MKVAKVSEMKHMDRRAVEEYGIGTEILMENAGNAAYSVIRNEFGIKDKKFVVVCGPGNNGGDGFVVARKLHSEGGRVKVVMLISRNRYQGAARENIEILVREQVETKELISAEDMRADITGADVIIDAILGTGVDRRVEGLYSDAVQMINESGKKVIALDIASGINGNNGQEMGAAVQAYCTVTFGLPKVGNLLYPGFARGGRLFLSHISFPPPLYENGGLKIEISEPAKLPERMPDAGKMDFGPVLVIAGAAGYYWAPYASAYSCLKAGGGYVYLACPRSLVPAIAVSGREIVFRPQKETASGSIALENKKELIDLAAKVRAVILGPGLSLDTETQTLVRELTGEIDKPLIIDADGIRAVAGNIALLKERKSATVLTPHIGEMAALTHLSKAEIEKDRVGILQETAAKLNAIIVLKGAHSLTGLPDGRVFINTSGRADNKSAMATAGTGDLLNGTIAAMFCLGLDIEDAVRAGVFIHGLSGDLAACEKGADGLTAQDVLDFLPYTIKYYRENGASTTQTYGNTVFTI